MYRKAVVLLATLALALFLTIASAKTTDASPAGQTGSFQTNYYNYFDGGGLACPGGAAFVTGDTEIWKYWPENTSPVPGIINTTNYMVCWSGTVYFPSAGTYTVYTLNDDGMNVWVNGNIAMNAWYNQGPTWHQGDFNIPAPGWYSFNVKYYNAPNAGVACVTWALKGQPYTWKCPYPPAPPPPPPPICPGCPPCQGCPPIYPTPPPVCPGCPPCQGCPPIYPTPPPVCPGCPPCQGCPPVYPPPPPCQPWPNCNQPPPHVTCWYRVQYGDTLYSIAWKFGVTTWQLQQWNNIPN